MYSGLQVRITPGISSFVWQTKIPLQFISQKKINCRPPDISHLFFFFVLSCFVLPCYLVTLHSLGFSELSRCVGKLCLAVITLVNKFVMLVPVETVPVLGKGPVRVENQVSFFFVCLKKKKSKEMSSSICLSVALVTTAAQSQ